MLLQGAAWHWAGLSLLVCLGGGCGGGWHCAGCAWLGSRSTEPRCCCCLVGLCMCTHAEYLHDPEEVKAERRRQQLAKERELLAARSGAWRPGGQVKTDATRSIVRMNL